MLISRKLARVQNNVTLLESEIALNETIGISSLVQRRIIERCIIQLQVEFELFVRNYIFDCATGRYSNSGVVINNTLGLQFKTREAACHHLLAKYKTKREPPWAIPKDAIAAANNLGLSNIGHISAELGITPWELDNLRFVRNFVAHRSKESALKLRTLGLVPPKSAIDPIAIVVAPSPSGGKNYERWAGFIRGIAKRLVT